MQRITKYNKTTIILKKKHFVWMLNRNFRSFYFYSEKFDSIFRFFSSFFVGFIHIQYLLHMNNNLIQFQIMLTDTGEDSKYIAEIANNPYNTTQFIPNNYTCEICCMICFWCLSCLLRVSTSISSISTDL